MPWPAYLAESAFNPGCSFRQGPHQAAQNTSTVLEALKSTVSAAPSSAWPERLGAAAPTRPLGAACETSGCRLHPASRNNMTNQGQRPSKLVDRARLGVGEGSPEPKAGGRRRRGCPQQRLVQHFVDVLDQNELHRVLDFFGYFVEVFAIFLRQDEDLDAGPMRGQQLLFEPADGQHFAPQRDLACHRHLAADTPAGERRHNGGRHRDARRRTILWDGAGRHMDVEEMILEEAGLQPKLERVRPRVADGSTRRLLHDLADLPRQRELTTPLHQDRLDRHDIATIFVDGHTGDGTDLIFQLGNAELEARRPQVAHHVARLDEDFFGLAFGDATRNLTGDVGDFAVQVPYPGFVRVLANQ